MRWGNLSWTNFIPDKMWHKNSCMTASFRPYVTLVTLWHTVLKALGMRLALGNWSSVITFVWTCRLYSSRVITCITFSQSSELWVMQTESGRRVCEQSRCGCLWSLLSGLLSSFSVLPHLGQVSLILWQVQLAATSATIWDWDLTVKG